MFWAQLMALLGGGREEEILQLSPEDFETTGGIHYYRLHNRPGNSIKSDAGHRLVPVHPELVRLGLIELVELRRRACEPRLFPHLKRGKHKETFTELWTKEFTKYRQANKVYWRGLVFHALRTTFHLALMENLVPGYVKRALMGHEPLDEGEKSYAQDGISMKTLHGVISEIHINLEQVPAPSATGTLSPKLPPSGSSGNLTPRGRRRPCPRGAEMASSRLDNAEEVRQLCTGPADCCGCITRTKTRDHHVLDE